MKAMKAQVEFIVIFALIAVAAVVILVSSRLFVIGDTNPAITGIEQEKKLVSDSILNAIRNAAKDELKEIYRTGASEAAARKISYSMKDVGIWQDCDFTQTPNVERLLQNKLKESLTTMFKPEMEFFGKKVYFDVRNIDVIVKLQDNGVKIDVDMPTIVENSSIAQPYSIVVPSRLKKILETSKEITDNNNASRFFEAATINTILHSNPEIEEKWLPTIDLKTGCWNTIFKTEQEAADTLETLAKYTASHTVYNRQIMEIPDNPFYVFGVSDSSINVSFIYPDEWDMAGNIEITPNPLVFYPKPILSFSSVCIETTDVQYSMRYPMIVSIKDDAIGELFNFVIMVNIDDNQPGCGFVKATKAPYYEKCFLESGCAVTINVKDANGLPLPNALVTFGECSLGWTDYTGALSSLAPCMIGELAAHKEGYREYRKLVKSSDLHDYAIAMETEGKEMMVHFYGVPLKPGEYMGGGKYVDYSVSGQPREIKLFNEQYFVLVYMKPKEGENVMLYNLDASGFTSVSKAIIRSGSYDMFGAVVNNRTGDTVGYTESAYLSSGNENELYVYLPLVENLHEALQPSEIYKMKAAFGECNLNVVSASQQSVSVPCG